MCYKHSMSNSKTLRAYVVGNPVPVIRTFRTADPKVAARRAAAIARSLDRDFSDDMLVRVAGGMEFSVETATGKVEPVGEPTGQPGPAI